MTFALELIEAFFGGQSQRLRDDHERCILMFWFLVFTFSNLLLGCSSVACGLTYHCGIGSLCCRYHIICVVSGRMELLSYFLRACLSAAAVISLASLVFRCCFRALLHFVRSAARPFQDTVSMSTAFIYLTQTTLYLYRR